MEISLFPKQKVIFDDPTRFKVVSCGRRFGKSTVSAYILLLQALGLADGEFWIVSPSYAQSMVMYRMLNQIIRRHELEEHVAKRRNGAEVFLEFTNGARIYVKSGDHPDSLRGSGLNGCVIDEAAMVKPSVWKEALRPALADKRGWAILISTPKGKNWFWSVFQRGLRQEPGWASYQFPSWENPMMGPEEIDELRRTLPEDVFRQEIQAQFVEGGGLVFRNYRDILTAREQPYEPGRLYVGGVDLAKSQDFTVISIADLETREQVYLERFNQTSWVHVKTRVAAVSKQYGGCSMFIDSTGVGDPIADDLIQMGVPVYGYKFSQPSKAAAVVNLQILIANKSIRLIDDPHLVEEFDAFTYTLTPTGQLRYEAPEGYHDDVVIACCLMAYGLNGGIAQCVGDVDDGLAGESEWDLFAAVAAHPDDYECMGWDGEMDGGIALPGSRLRNLGLG